MSLFVSVEKKIKENNIFWDVKKDQFGTYLYIKSSENIIQDLIIHFYNIKTNVLNFEDGDFKNIFAKSQQIYNWRIKFSNFINLNNVWCEIINFAEKTNFEKYGSTSDKIKTEPDKQQIIVKQVSDEIEVQNNRISKEYKLLRDFIFYSYDNIAFHPSVIEIMIKRFKNIEKLSQLLNQINCGKNIKLKKIYKDNNQDGWRELDEHISDGVSKRARIYLRQSKISNCNYELYLDWKKDEKQQNRIFAKLSRLDNFSDRRVIYQ